MWHATVYAERVTESDRRLVILAASAIAGVSLFGFIGLAASAVVGLDQGEDIAPGVAALLLALLAIPGTVVAWLAPSPLSKSATAGETQEVTGPGGGPVPVTEEKKGR